MDLGLKGKAVVVTGASRGIGRAIAFAFAEEGAALALCSRKEEDIKKTAKEISSRYGVKVHAEARDLSKPEEVDGFVKGSIQALGRIDVLINNVGAGVTKAFEELSEAEWRDSCEKNLWVAVRCCRAFVPVMKAQGGGRIVNIAALSGKLPRLGQIASNVAKAALINLTESLACEAGPYGIRVNAVCPALVMTERWKERVERIARQRSMSYEATLKELARERIPAGRFGEPDDVAYLALFLSSNKSDFINGVSIEVDGGLGRCMSFEVK
jgi:3-oxoacyl-[acyl-carrier protein] reductase